MQKTLETKLASFRDSSSNRAFIIADAKDADMAFGIAAPGKTRNGSYRSLADFRDQIREVVAQGLEAAKPFLAELCAAQQRLS